MPYALTDDTLWNGRLMFRQPAKSAGYRFNLDPVLLAGFAPHADHVVDLGAGVGVIGLLMLAMGKAQQLTFVERQDIMLACLAHNIQQHNANARIIAGDLRSLKLPDADLVVFNPPYVAAHEGRASPNVSRDEARREVHGGLIDFCDAADRCLNRNGLMASIIPIQRDHDMQHALKRTGFSIIQRCVVFARPRDAQPHGLMLLCARTPAPHVQNDTLVIHASDEGRDFHPVVNAWVQGPT